MPATFGRRSWRQNSEDIEDDSTAGTQSRVAEDVSDAEPSQRRPKVEKKAKLEKKPVADPDEDDDSDDGASEDEAIDVTTLGDQPLPRDGADKLKGIVDDWLNLDSNTKQQWSMIASIAGSIADCTDEDEAEKFTQKLDEIMRELVDLSSEMVGHREALDELRQKIIQGEQIDDAFERYLEGADEKKANYYKMTTRQKYAKNSGYMEFRSAIWEAQHPDAPMPPLTDFIHKEDGDDSDDEDLEIGGQTQDFKCPISLTLMTDPLTSTLCGHSYSAAAIRSMLGRAQKACPAAGCKKKITINDCKPDLELAKKAKRYAQRIARREEAQHSDLEVIE